MGARINAVSALPNGSDMHTEIIDWQLLAQRLEAYLAAMGIDDRRELDRLSEQVRRRVEVRRAAAPLENALEAVIEETHALLDEWLIAELALEGDANALAAARASVLSGNLPGWSARWSGLSDVTLDEAIRAQRLTAVPEPAPLTMQPSVIDLCCARMRRRIAAAICRLFCQPNLPTNPSGARR